MKSKKILKIASLVLLTSTLAACGKEKVSEKEYKEWAEKNGYVLANDYNINTDADTISGASQNKETTENQLSQAEIKALVLDQLRGFILCWKKGNEVVYPEYLEDVYPYTQNPEQIATLEKEGYSPVYSYREMYQIATSYNNVPEISSVEYVIDTDTMKLYGSSEAGTAKVVEIVSNPNVSLYWTKQVAEEDYYANSSDTNDYWRSYGVQIIGTARIIDPTVEATLYNKVFNLYMNTMRGAKSWDSTPEATKTYLANYLSTLNIWYEISPTQINSHNLWNMYNKDNECSTATIDTSGETPKVVQTAVACPVVPAGTTPTEEVIQSIIDSDTTTYAGYQVNKTASLNSTKDAIVWTQKASVGSLYKWTGGLQKKWSMALYGKFYRQVLTDFTVTPQYPSNIIE